MPELIEPDARRHAAWLEAHREWGPGRHEDGFGVGPEDDVDTPSGFADWVRRLQSRPGRLWWILDEDTVVGGIVLRPFTNDVVLRVGHVGYGIRPSARRRGLATWALAEVLRRAREEGLPRVLLVCADDNAASIRTIERAGGVLHGTVEDGHGPVRHYWIDLADRAWEGPHAAARSLVERASAEFERVVRELPGEAWELPTPSEISVRDLVEHVVVGNRFTAMLIAGESRAEARARLEGDQLGDDPLAAVRESARQQQAGFAAAPPERILDGPKGAITAERFLRFRLIDLVVHAWDLLRATGQGEALDPVVVEGLLAVVEPHLDEILSFGAYGDGPSGTLPPDAGPQLRLLDMVGRRP